MLEEYVGEKKGFIMDLALMLEKDVPEENIKSNGKLLAIKVDAPKQINTNEEYNKFIDSIKKCISAIFKKESEYENPPFDKCVIYLDFKPTKQFLFAYAKGLMIYRLNLAKGYGSYHNIDIEIGKYGKWKHSLHKAEKKIISRETKSDKKDDLEILTKHTKHLIEGPDLRFWPFRDLGIVAEEIVEGKTHVVKRYIKPKHMIYKPPITRIKYAI